MVRLANRFTRLGHRVFRADMRGSGAGTALARQLNHAGRSDDLMLALGFAAKMTESGQLQAAGVSLGANQLLRGVGRIGAGLDETPTWFSRLERIAAVAPPLDLLRCSVNMQRLSRRLYNYYFIRQLLHRIPSQVRERDDCQAILAGPRPKTLRELDDRMTAPLSGFVDAAEYYDFASAKHVVMHNPVETLLIAAEDDPIVPVRLLHRRLTAIFRVDSVDDCKRRRSRVIHRPRQTQLDGRSAGAMVRPLSRGKLESPTTPHTRVCRKTEQIALSINWRDGLRDGWLNPPVPLHSPMSNGFSPVGINELPRPCCHERGDLLRKRIIAAPAILKHFDQMKACFHLSTD